MKTWKITKNKQKLFKVLIKLEQHDWEKGRCLLYSISWSPASEGSRWCKWCICCSLLSWLNSVVIICLSERECCVEKSEGLSVLCYLLQFSNISCEELFLSMGVTWLLAVLKRYLFVILGECWSLTPCTVWRLMIKKTNKQMNQNQTTYFVLQIP